MRMVKIVVSLCLILPSVALASALPESFTVKLEKSSDVTVPLEVTTFESTADGATSNPSLRSVLDTYIDLNSNKLFPGTPEVRVYRVETQGERGFSPGYDRHDLQILAKLIPFFRDTGFGCSDFKKKDSLTQHLVAYKQSHNYVATAANLATLILKLSEHTDLIDRHYYLSSCTLSSFEGANFEVFFVDPRALRGDDQYGYMVVHHHGWGE